MSRQFYTLYRLPTLCSQSVVGGGRDVACAKDAIAKGGNTARGRDRFHQKDEEEGGPLGVGGVSLSSGVGGGGGEVEIGGGHFTVAQWDTIACLACTAERGERRMKLPPPTPEGRNHFPHNVCYKMYSLLLCCTLYPNHGDCYCLLVARNNITCTLFHCLPGP